MGSVVGQIFPTASLHRDHSILYALVCEKEFSHMGKNNGSPHLVCKDKMSNIWPESSSLSLLCVRAMKILGYAKLPELMLLDDALGTKNVCWPYIDGNSFLKNESIRIHNECEGRIEKSVPRIAVWHHEACPVMTNGDHEG